MPDIAALSALDTTALVSGNEAWVSTVRATWVLDKTSALAPEVPAITIAPANPVGQWIRMPEADPRWLYVNNWYINANTGNDEANGQTPATPLRTHAELARRWGGGALRPTQTQSGTSVYCAVILQTSLPSTDPVYPNCILPTTPTGLPTYLWYPGGAEGAPLYTGSFTGVTAINAATNQELRLTDAAIGTWAAYLGRRWRITAGARLNTIGWVARDLGAQTARSSPGFLPSNMNPASSANWPTFQNGNAQTPQVGDPFVIENLLTISIAANVAAAGVAFAPQNNRVVWGELAVRNGAILGMPGSAFYSTDFQAGQTWHSHGVFFANCRFANGVSIFGGQPNFVAGLVGNSSGNGQGLTAYQGAVTSLQSDILCQGCGIRGTNININAAWVFDNVVTGQFPGGNGLYVGPTGNAANNAGSPTRSSVYVSGYLNGSGNAGAGVSVASGSSLGIFGTVRVTGAAGDFLVAGVATSRAWNEMTGAYTAPVPNTWTNWSLAILSGGLGSYAQDVKSQASVIFVFVT